MKKRTRLITMDYLSYRVDELIKKNNKVTKRLDRLGMKMEKKGY